MSLAEKKPIDLANIMAVVTQQAEELSAPVTFPSTIELDWVIYDVAQG